MVASPLALSAEENPANRQLRSHGCEAVALIETYRRPFLSSWRKVSVRSAIAPPHAVCLTALSRLNMGCARKRVRFFCAAGVDRSDSGPGTRSSPAAGLASGLGKGFA